MGYSIGRDAASEVCGSLLTPNHLDTAGRLLTAIEDASVTLLRRIVDIVAEERPNPCASSQYERPLGYSLAPRNRSALPITETELKDIANAATTGLSRMPNIG